MLILVADDEPALVEFVRKGLQAEGHTVDAVADGIEALDRALSGEYACLVLDWNMPRRSGVEICQAVRARGLTTPTPISRPTPQLWWALPARWCCRGRCYCRRPWSRSPARSTRAPISI